ncbi:MAG TPA: DUF2249 domain-containing protein, partial [Ottowia sp.]|nr:DUF2249 domain-containing protein [Ottowia sp.]
MALTPPPQNPPGHDHRTPEAIYGFDARGVAKRFRHAAIFGALDSLHPGEVMRFVNDHDPIPLLGQMQARYGEAVPARYRPRAPQGRGIHFIPQQGAPPH